MPFNSASANSEFASINAARCVHWPPSTWAVGEVGTVGMVGAVGAVGVPLDPPEDPPHATLNNASRRNRRLHQHSRE